jgi:DNA repair protein RAD7
MAANPPPGYLCHHCAKASGTDPFKKPAVPRKRVNAAEKRNVVSYQERRLPSLATMCIEVGHQKSFNATATELHVTAYHSLH